MKNLVFCSHHKVRFAKGVATLFTLGAVQAHIVLLAVGLPVTDKTSTVLIEEHLALGTLKTGGVPGKVWSNSKDELVMYDTSAAHTERGTSSQTSFHRFWDP